MLDWTSQLNPGETIASVVAVVTPIQTPPVGAVAVTVTGITLAPSGTQAVFFVQGGADGISYEVQFLGTSSIGQIFEDVVEVDIQEKL
jgi:hypothetical protein